MEVLSFHAQAADSIQRSATKSSLLMNVKPSKSERKPLFRIWKRSFKPEVLALLEGRQEDNANTTEWASEIFSANLFPAKLSISQLRSAYLTNKQTQILAALLPNEIIYTKNPLKNELQTFVGVLLFADVSGFTALCEKYNNTGKGGTYRLTATLNGYIGAMVEVIYCHGGDVLKFSGDAFLALWKVKRGDVISHTIHRVISCATYIQQTLGSFETDVKVFLKVKLAISAGNLFFSVVGNDQGRHYICIGTPIDDVKAAEHTCVSGDIVLSPSAWGHCSPLNYEFSFKDQYHVKVTRILYDPSSKKRQVVGVSRLPPITVNINLHGTRDTDDKEDEKDETEKEEEIEGGDPNTEESWLPTKIEFKRTQLQEAAKKHMGAALRQYLIPPVVQQVDADQPLEYLTEMRQVTIMFINIIPAKMTHIQLVAMSDAAYTTISSLVRTSLGCVNKMCLFDKDCMLLVIFGLRGFKTELESQNALKCAYRVRREVSDIEGVDCVSVGVTTGMTYCGVVGHPLRKEYTVIGGVVNKAARIMCAYPGKVTTEQITYQLSKLPASNFIPQEAKELKGLGTVAFIYEYTEDRSHLEGNELPAFSGLPLLGREQEMSVLYSILTETSFPTRQQNGLLVTGEPRIGKSRFLEEIASEAQKWGYRYVLIVLDSFHSNTAYSLAYLLMKQVLNLGDNCSMHDREERLLSVLGKFVPSERFCYLNDLMQVKFSHSMAFITDDDEERMQITLDLLDQIINLSSEKYIICIDDIHNVDSESLRVLLHLIEHNQLIVVMTLQSSDRPVAAAEDVLSHENVRQLKLPRLDDEHIAPLACQFLNVRAIPVELNNLLQSRSGGNPGWCENYLVSLLHSGGIALTDTYLSGATEDLIVPNKKLVSKTWIDTEINVTEEVAEEEDEEIVPICIVPSGQNLDMVLLPQNLDAIIMTAFDSLPPYEQLLLKCGAVLGHTFTRTMLAAVMHNPNPAQTATAVQRVFEMRILCCATDEGASPNVRRYSYALPKCVSVPPSNRVTCYCNPSLDRFVGWQSLPRYAFCQLMHFRIPVFRDTTYELLPGNQKKDFHARAAAFLEGEAHKCEACGAGNFVTVPSVLIQEMDELKNRLSLLSDSTLESSQTNIVPDVGSKRGSVGSVTASKRSSIGSETGGKRGSVSSEAGIRKGSNSSQVRRRKGSDGSEAGRKRVNIALEASSKRGSVEPEESSQPRHSNVSFHRLSAHSVIGRNKVAPSTSRQDEGRSNKVADTSMLKACFGLQRTPKKEVTMQKYSTFSMGNTFTTVDFRNCECPLILAGVYQQLIDHCTGAGLKEKQIRFLIEYGAANITMGNNVQAISILETAMELCTHFSDSEKSPDRYVIKLDLGKIHTLLGQAHLDLGQLPQARQHLMKAMRFFGQRFWSKPIVSGVLVQFHKSRQKLHQMFPTTFIGRGQGKQAVVNDEASACLAHLNNLFMMNKDWGLARLAALKSLNLAQKSPNNMAEICTAYSNLMDVCHHFGELEYCKQLEMIALKHKYTVGEAKDLLALGRLYCALFSSRGLRGELESAISIGFRVMQISSRVNANNVKLYILPLLLEAMAMTARCSEGVDLFAVLESLAREDVDKSAQTWYYALGLDMILDTGFTVQPSRDCLDYAREMFVGTEGKGIIRDPDAEKRMIVSSWVWYTRTQEWQEASKWEKLAMRYTGDQLEYSFSNMVTMLKLLEGMLIHLSIKLGKSRPRGLEPWRSETHTFLKKIQRVAMVMNIIQPRFYHMKAYYWQIYQHKTKAARLIRKAKELSKIQGNKLEESWTGHSEAHWSGRLNNIDRYFWKEHNSYDSGVDWHEFDQHSWSSVMYTFETPFHDTLK